MKIEDYDNDQVSVYISQANINGTDYLIKDQASRSALSSLDKKVQENTEDIAQNASDIVDLKESVKGGVHYRGKTTTELTDGCSTNPINILSGDLEVPLTAIAGDMVIYEGDEETITTVEALEFIFNGENWNRLGSTKGLGSLAFKNDATGNFVPSGNVNVNAIADATYDLNGSVSMNQVNPSGSITINEVSPTATFSGTQGDVLVSGSVNGTITKPNITVTPTSAQIGSATVNNEILTITFGTALTNVTAELQNAPELNNATCSASGTFTPNGSVNVGKFTPTGSVSINSFTPTGSVSGTTTILGHTHGSSFSGSTTSVTVS